MARVDFAPSFRVTELFLDRARVLAAIDAAAVRALSRQGAFVRRRAITRVLRRRKRVSAAGEPPSVHSTGLGLKTIFFYFDPKSKTVVVGPVKLNQVNQTTRGRMTVPQLLEFGGTARIHEMKYEGGSTWFRRDLRRSGRPGEQRRTRSASYRRRPFMSVALRQEIEAGTIADSWRNAVRDAA